MKIINEKAPPGKEAEEWIKSSKDSFKDQYGDDWEEVLYATAWKKFGNKNESVHEDSDDPCWDGYEQYGMKKKDGKEVPNCVPKNESETMTENQDKNLERAKNIALNIWKERGLSYESAVDKAIEMLSRRGVKVDRNKLLKSFHESIDLMEHENFDEYVKPWADQGYDIDVYEYVKADGTTGLKFTIESDEISTEIYEPETGVYEVQNETFDSFDEAMGFVIQDERNPDMNIYENEIEQIAKNAGIVKENNKERIDENISEIPTMGVVGSGHTDLKSMIQKIDEMMNDDLQELKTINVVQEDEDSYVGETDEDKQALEELAPLNTNFTLHELEHMKNDLKFEGYQINFSDNAVEHDYADLESNSHKPNSLHDRNFKRTNNQGDNSLKVDKDYRNR